LSWAGYVKRYAPVAKQAGVSFPFTIALGVVERLPGGPTTAFAAPEFDHDTAARQARRAYHAEKANRNRALTGWRAATHGADARKLGRTTWTM